MTPEDPSRRSGTQNNPRRRATDHVDPNRVLAGGGEMGALMRSIDWAKTPIGPVADWSPALRSTVALLLHNSSGLLLWWGPEFVQIYNDAYRPVLGEKHPRAMGQRVSECWSEIWHIIGPMIERPFRGGPASTSDDLHLALRRKHFLEEAHFRVAYSPVPDETVETGIGGVLATVTETTEAVYAERQLRTLRELGARSAEAAKTAEEACSAAADTVRQNAWDVPFALFYLLDRDGKRARLVSSAGIPADRDHACPWPLEQVAHEKSVVIVEDLSHCAWALPQSPWGERPRAAIVLPLASPEQTSAYGVLVCGVSPHRLLDAGYRTFFEIAAAQIVTAIRNARALEEERRRAEALAEIDRAKTAFFSNISHEFRTPLTLMLGPTEELLAGAHGALGGEQRQQLELIHRNEKRLYKLVNSLLDFARIEAGRIEASYEAIDLGAFTRDLASSFRAAIERAGLVFDVDCAALEPVYVDRNMWEKIVLNLLSNAFKFTFEGRIELTLREEGGRVVLRVADTGIGVPEHEVPRLFERFHRVEGARSRTHEGSGIGLALVQELVRLHGGTAQVESRLGAGTTFSVVIPKGSSHLPNERIGARSSMQSTALGTATFVEEALRWLPDRGESPSADSIDANGGEQAKGPARILLADDNADMRDYVRRILEPHWAVDAVEDGAKALAMARERPPHLILTDVMMPHLDGLGLLKELRRGEATSVIPVIMLSARAGEDSRVEGLAAGADDYLVKPFSSRELIARVRLHLENVRLRQERERRIQDAERTVRFSEMFVGILGHDLRNPLSAIATAANLLEGRADSERIARPVRRIISSAERMDRMITQLLDFTSIRLGRGLPLSLGRVDLAKECRAAVEELQPVHPIEIRVEAIGDSEGVWDRDRISQLLSNLVANACQHGTQGTPVEIWVDGSSPDSVHLEIRNHGLIPPSLLPMIFEPLRQGDGLERRNGSSGLGLGLFITQQVVLAHGGSIRAESDDDLGTRFVLDLPRRLEEKAEHVFAAERGDGAS